MYACTYLIVCNISKEWIEPCPKAKISNINHQQDPHDYKEVPHLEWLHMMRQQLLTFMYINTLSITHTYIFIHITMWQSQTESVPLD